MRILILVIVMSIIVVSCTNKSDSPEGALQQYIQQATSSEQGRDFYINRTTGKLLTVIESMTDEEFQHFASLKNLESVKFEIMHKNCQESRCFMTYEIEYRQNFEQNGAFESTSKKIAELSLVNGEWKIADVTNVKSYIDSKTPLKISASPESKSDK